MKKKDSFAHVAFSFVLGYAEQALRNKTRLVEEYKPYIPEYDFSGRNPEERREYLQRIKESQQRNKECLQKEKLDLETAIEQLHKLWDKWSSCHD